VPGQRTVGGLIGYGIGTTAYRFVRRCQKSPDEQNCASALPFDTTLEGRLFVVRFVLPHMPPSSPDERMQLRRFCRNRRAAPGQAIFSYAPMLPANTSGAPLVRSPGTRRNSCRHHRIAIIVVHRGWRTRARRMPPTREPVRGPNPRKERSTRSQDNEHQRLQRRCKRPFYQDQTQRQNRNLRRGPAPRLSRSKI